MRSRSVSGQFSLAQTCGPAAWGRGRWPSADWRDGAYWWVGWEGEALVWRTIHQTQDAPGLLSIAGPADPGRDDDWLRDTLGVSAEPPAFADPVLRRLQETLPGLRPYASGSIAEGLITSIVGQSISVAAAAVTEGRLAALYHDGIELDGRRFLPFPRLDQLADSEAALVRQSGVTWRRAEAIIVAARAALDGALPTTEDARRDPDGARAALRSLPLVGPWTAESALLWGIGHPDAHPTGDVALLRAARLAYSRTDLTMKALDGLADGWRPNRGWAARLLWTNLFGPAPGGCVEAPSVG